MQLKTVGESLTVTKTINEVLKSTAHLGNSYMDNAVRANALAVATKGYSAEAIKAAIAQSTLNETQIRAILVEKGFKGQLLETTTAELAQATATNALAASEAGATASTLGLGAAFKGLGASIKAFALSNPILTAIAAIGVAIYGAVKAYDALTVSLEEQKEKLQETKEAYEDIKSELQELEDELQNTKDKVEELANTPNLSWVEQEELDRLREVTKELELQKQLKQDAQLESAEDLFNENKKTFNKEFKSSYGNTSVEEFKEQLSLGYIGIGQLDYKNITDLVSALQYLNEEKAKLTDESEIAEYEEWIDGLTDSVKSNGQEYLSSLTEYKQNILEIASIRDLTKDEQDFYDYLLSMQKMIYEFYSPAIWNGLEFDSIFNTEGIEKTKDELIAMYRSGELSSAKMLEQFPKLNEAIKESEIIAGEGSDVFKEFFNEIAALAEEQGDLVNDVLDDTKVSLSISDTIDQLNTQLKPTFDSLKSAYQSIFTSDGYNPNAVDIPMLDSIKSSIEEINKLEDVDITIDMDAFDDLATTLTDVNTTEEQAKQAFNDFATSIFYAANATDGMTDETKELVEQLLESLGIVNATEVAEYALAEAKAKDVLATYDLAMASAESEAAKVNEFHAILAEGEAAGITRQQIYSLTAAEIAFGNNNLNTEGKIAQLRNLAKAYGDTASAALATAIANDLASGHTDTDTAINNLMAQINTGIQKVDIDFSPIEKSAAKAGSSAGKSYADALKDELSNLNSVISYIGDVIDDQIDLFEDQKDAAVDALEAEKEAAEEALEAEKELAQEKIDAKQAEVDAIEDAAKARKNELDLQQKQYDLERMQNQKTMLVNYMPDTIVI